MGKGSGGTRSSSSGGSSTNPVETEVFKYSEEQSAKMIANIHTTNIHGTDDNYTNQEKVASILKVNEQLSNAGFDGFKVRSLNLQADGTLTVGSIGILMHKGSIPQTNSYAIVTPVYEPQNHYWRVQYEGVKFETTTLENIKDQAEVALSNKFSKSKNKKYDSIHNLNAHVENSDTERIRIDRFSGYLHQILRKK